MTDEQLMLIAIEEAKLAEDHGDVPIGALVVLQGDIVSSRHNERELQNDPTAHAEVLAIRDAARKLGTSRLDGATLVSTLEPCPMCAGAALSARISRVVFGADVCKFSDGCWHWRVNGSAMCRHIVLLMYTQSCRRPTYV